MIVHLQLPSEVARTVSSIASWERKTKAQTYRALLVLGLAAYKALVTPSPEKTTSEGS
jgi:hypothetical protein